MTRKEILLTLDEKLIRDYAKENHIELPKNQELFWLMVHKAITGHPNIPRGQKLESAKYLAERRSEHFMTGVREGELK